MNATWDTPHRPPHQAMMVVPTHWSPRASIGRPPKALTMLLVRGSALALESKYRDK